MLDLKVAPFLGAIIITDAAWRRVPDNLKQQFLQAAQAVARQMDDEVQALDDQALATMLRFGLTVQEISPAVADEWITDVSRYDDAMRTVFDARMTVRVQNLLAEFENR